MNLKEKTLEGIEFCNSSKSDSCEGCPYLRDDKWSDDGLPLCVGNMETDALKIIKAYDFALSQYNETLEELIENNDGDVKEICVFLLNLLRIKEKDIGEGLYIE